MLDANTLADDIPRSTVTPENGTPWLDDRGDPVHASGGGLIRIGEHYFLFGERRHRFHEFAGVGCYRSRDLLSWTNLDIALTDIAEPGDHERPRKFVERPKVVFCDRTGQYVMWMHLEWGGYEAACCGVAVADAPEGPYRFLRSFRPNGRESRDCTLFKDVDGTAYFVSSTDRNASLAFHRLTDDYLDVTGDVVIACENEHREAPTLFHRHGMYHLLSSGCTGFPPNPLRHHVARSILGPWSSMGNPCHGRGESCGFESQPTFAIESPTGEWIYCADRWRSADLARSTFVWLPIEFNGDEIALGWRDEWTSTDNVFSYTPSAAGPRIALADASEKAAHLISDASDATFQLTRDGSRIELIVRSDHREGNADVDDPWRRPRLEVWFDYHQFAVSPRATGEVEVVGGAGFDADRPDETAGKVANMIAASVETSKGVRTYRVVCNPRALQIKSLEPGNHLAFALLLVRHADELEQRDAFPRGYAWGRMNTFARLIVE